MKKRDIGQVLAENLKGARKRAKLSQGALGKKAGVLQSVISEAENQKSSTTIGTVGKLADALGCQYWELFADTKETREAALRKMLGGAE